MKKVAFLLASESFAGEEIPKIPFARQSAEQLAAAFRQLGVASDDCVMLSDEQLTPREILTVASQVAGKLSDEDVLYLYVAGRVFSWKGENYLVCHDSQWSDLPATSVSIAELIGKFRARNFGRLMMFLDWMPLVGAAVAESEGAVETPVEADLRRLFADRPTDICFVACRADEESYRSRQLQRSIWTHHLGQAMHGTERSILKRGVLTSADLERYLAQSVPRTLRTTFSRKRLQTPWSCSGSQDELVIADLQEVLERSADPGDHEADMIGHVAFTASQTTQVKQLAGFQKSHRVPEVANEVAHKFIARLANEELTHNIDRVYALLKDAFRFVRTDLQTSIPGDGTGTIVTPYFDYSIAVSLNPENPAEVVWETTINSIQELEAIQSTAFDKVFRDAFDTLEFTWPRPVQLEPIIDAFEAQATKAFQVEYDREVTYCELRVKGISAAIRLTPRALLIRHSRPQRPRALMKSFQSLQDQILQHGMSLITLGNL